MAMTAAFVVERLAPSHDHTEFLCGVDALDRYFRYQAGQDVRRRTTACFVARDVTTGGIAGYYTLAAGGIPLAEMFAALSFHSRGAPGPVSRCACVSGPQARRRIAVGCRGPCGTIRGCRLCTRGGRQRRPSGEILSASRLYRLCQHAEDPDFALEAREPLIGFGTNPVTW